MEAKYISEWDTSDGESIAVTSTAEINLPQGKGKIGFYESALDQQGGTTWSDKLESLNDEYFLVGEKRFTAMHARDYYLNEEEIIKNRDEYDKYGNGIIIYD